MRYNHMIRIHKKNVSLTSPTYFIADIASNHDGDLERAKELIYLAKRAGADAAKFQHFLAKDIVSDYGFKRLGGQIAHQSAWKQSVYEVYEKCELNRAWTEELAKTAAKAGVDFMTSPYDFEAVDQTDPYVPAFKIGSGDITWTEMVRYIAGKGKPVILATGASDMAEVERAVEAILSVNPNIALLQCNTNYTGSLENLRYVNLNVLHAFAKRWPGMVLGLSDHTPGHATVLGAVALGARVIEKHFTDDNDRQGPDHPFSMNPATWKDMVLRTRELEAALGDGIKRVEANEKEAAVVQRRCLRLKRGKKRGETLGKGDLEALRPAPAGSVVPYRLEEVLGKALAGDKDPGDALYETDVRR